MDCRLRNAGVVPSVVLTAVFYAFHHIGFQPEYGKLIFVGLLYASIFRMGNSVFMIFPFFLDYSVKCDATIVAKYVRNRLPKFHWNEGLARQTYIQSVDQISEVARHILIACFCLCAKVFQAWAIFSLTSSN